MTEMCQDPLSYLVERLCCRVYLDNGGNVRLGFSRWHDLKDMMTAQGIARSNARLLRDRLRQEQAPATPESPGDPVVLPDPAAAAAFVGPVAADVRTARTAPAKDDTWAGHVANGEFCPLI